jgi:DNA-directed RNA polymerase subunit N (RpoN/RPB10)
LGENPDQLTIGTVNENEKVCELWLSVQGDRIEKMFKVPIEEPTVINKIYTAWKEGKKSVVIDISGDELKKYEDFRKRLPEYKEYNDIKKSTGKEEHRRVIHCAFFPKGLLSLATPEPRPEETRKLLERFAGVFDLTYTRFLDLTKAEAQAREAEIELGLERVRARAMAMQKSDELSDLVNTVFKELTKLDFALSWCIINIIDESTLSNTVWAASPNIDEAPDSYHMKFEDYPFHHAMMKGYKERRTKFIYVLEGDEKKIYDEYLFNDTEFRKVPAEAQAASKAMKKYVVSFTFSNFGGLQTVGEESLSDSNLDILARFGKVFDLTYTRFNDLLKAEAQARESQIQLALERVRARTMAMQHSRELSETASIFFKQLSRLGIETNRLYIGIFKDDSGIMELQKMEVRSALSSSLIAKKIIPLKKCMMDGKNKENPLSSICKEKNFRIIYDIYRKKCTFRLQQVIANTEEYKALLIFQRA